MRYSKCFRGGWIDAWSQIICAVNDGPSQSASSREAIDPADEIIRVRKFTIKNFKKFVKILRNEYLYIEIAGVYLFQFQCNGSKTPEHSKTAHDGMEQIGVRLPANVKLCSGSSEKFECTDMLADRSGVEIILPMNIHRKNAAERGKHRSRDDRRPPAVLDRVFP